MDHSGREDRKLSEVKAVLRRLQGLPAEPEPSGLSSGESSRRFSRRIGGAVGIAVAVVAIALVVAYAFPRPQEAAKSAAAGGKGASVVQTTAAADGAPQGDPLTIIPKRGPQSTTPLPSDRLAPPAMLEGVADGAKTPVARPALEAALVLMNSGRVQLARKRLRAMAADGSPDVTWALARSYDPNSLKAIPAADAAPDIEEAARWYRIWYATAVKQGLVADSVSLERIIGTMKR